MTMPRIERYCFQCKTRKPEHSFAAAQAHICQACANDNAALGRTLRIADGTRPAIAAAAKQLERDAKANKINLPAISELADGLFKEFGGVAEVCQLARAVFETETKTSAKVKLDVLKFIANILLAAHEKEGQMGDLDEMSEQELDDTIIQLAEMRGWKFTRPEVA